MHEYFHTRFGFCMWDIGALAVLVAMVVVLVVHVVRQKRRASAFEDELAEQMANASQQSDKKE